MPDENGVISQFPDVIPLLPPSLMSADVMGRLLHNKTFINKIPGYLTVVDLVRMEVLGRFIHECINWLEHAEREKKEGLISDDRFAEGVQNVSLISFVIGSIADLVFVYVRRRHSLDDALELWQQTITHLPSKIFVPTSELTFMQTKIQL